MTKGKRMVTEADNAVDSAPAPSAFEETVLSLLGQMSEQFTALSDRVAMLRET